MRVAGLPAVIVLGLLSASSEAVSPLPADCTIEVFYRGDKGSALLQLLKRHGDAAGLRCTSYTGQDTSLQCGVQPRFGALNGLYALGSQAFTVWAFWDGASPADRHALQSALHEFVVAARAMKGVDDIRPICLKDYNPFSPDPQPGK